MDKKQAVKIGIIFVTIIEFIVFVTINSSLYKGIFNIGIIIAIIPLQVVLTFNFLRDKLKSKRPKLWLLCFYSIPIILFLVGKPTYTYNQAEDLVLEKFKNEITILDNGEETFRDTVPIYTEDFRFFINARDYHFKGVTETNEYRYFLVNARTGEIIEMNQPYWQESY